MDGAPGEDEGAAGSLGEGNLDSQQPRGIVPFAYKRDGEPEQGLDESTEPLQPLRLTTSPARDEGAPGRDLLEQASPPGVACAGGSGGAPSGAREAKGQPAQPSPCMHGTPPPPAPADGEIPPDMETLWLAPDPTVQDKGKSDCAAFKIEVQVPVLCEPGSHRLASMCLSAIEPESL